MPEKRKWKMRSKIIFATSNEDKMKEIRMILEYGEITSLKEEGIETYIEENGSTFEENALIKARIIGKQTGEITMADDSGLEIDYLNKEPGIYSARYGGENTPYSIKNKMLLDRLKGVDDEKRTARFVCAIAVVFPDGRERTVRSSVEGQIGYEERGQHGFGYDPIFYVPEYGCTMAEMEPEEKNKISHRGRALNEMKKQLQQLEPFSSLWQERHE